MISDFNNFMANTGDLYENCGILVTTSVTFTLQLLFVLLLLCRSHVKEFNIQNRDVAGRLTTLTKQAVVSGVYYKRAFLILLSLSIAVRLVSYSARIYRQYSGGRDSLSKVNSINGSTEKQVFLILLDSLPAIFLASSYGVIVTLWAEIHHAFIYLKKKSFSYLYILANLFVYSGIFLLVISLWQFPMELKRDFILFNGFLSVFISIFWGYYGSRVTSFVFLTNRNTEYLSPKKVSIKTIFKALSIQSRLRILSFVIPVILILKACSCLFVYNFSYNIHETHGSVSGYSEDLRAFGRNLVQTLGRTHSAEDAHMTESMDHLGCLLDILGDLLPSSLILVCTTGSGEMSTDFHTSYKGSCIPYNSLEDPFVPETRSESPLDSLYSIDEVVTFPLPDDVYERLQYFPSSSSSDDSPRFNRNTWKPYKIRNLDSIRGHPNNAC